tara:strand:+ start:2122 stop:3099 length:978 start_codon:yes stop_codon:yes gene_type:complete
MTTNKVRFMKPDDYPDRSAMLETGSEDDSESGSDEWQRQIVQMNPDVAFLGKITIGTHKVYRRKLLSKIFARDGTHIFGMKGSTAARWVIKQHATKKTPDKLFLKFLKKNVGEAIVEEAVASMTVQKEGVICVIPKDKTSEPKRTKFERYDNIRGAWPHVLGSTKVEGKESARAFIKGQDVVILSTIFGEKMMASLAPEIAIEMKHDDETGKIKIAISAELVNTTLPDEDVQNLMFWLRWNSWTKFEKVVVANTDFDNFPTEWDSVYGNFWRAVNQKQARFEEIYEADAELDARLVAAISHGGKLSPEEEAVCEEVSIDVMDGDF